MTRSNGIAIFAIWMVASVAGTAPGKDKITPVEVTNFPAVQEITGTVDFESPESVWDARNITSLSSDPPIAETLLHADPNFVLTDVSVAVQTSGNCEVWIGDTESFDRFLITRPGRNELRSVNFANGIRGASLTHRNQGASCDTYVIWSGYYDNLAAQAETTIGVPEPSSIVLLGVGMMLFACLRRKRYS